VFGGYQSAHAGTHPPVPKHALSRVPEGAGLMPRALVFAFLPALCHATAATGSEGFDGSRSAGWELLDPASWTTSDGVLRCVDDAGERLALAPSPPLTEAIAQVDFRFIGGQRRNAALVFGYTGPGDFCMLRRYDSRAWLERLQIRGGEVVRIGGNHWLAQSSPGSAPAVDGQWYTLKLCLVEGVLRAKMWPTDTPEAGWMLTDELRLANPGRLGLATDESCVEFDNWLVDAGATLEVERQSILRERAEREAWRQAVRLGAEARGDFYTARFACRVTDPAKARVECLFRARDADSHYAVLVDRASIALVKRVDGATTVLATGRCAALREAGACVVEISVEPAEADADGPAWFIDHRPIPVPVRLRARCFRQGETAGPWQIETVDDPFIAGARGEVYWTPDVCADSSARIPLGDLLGTRLMPGAQVLRPEVQLAAQEPEDCAVWQPWRTIRTGPERGGCWMALGDVDGDGALDLVVARNDNQAVRALTAYTADGTELWRWGEGGKADIAYDVPVTVYDIDGDGANEVLCSVEGFLLALDGRTGREKLRWPLPEGLAVADCIIIANLRGRQRAEDLIVKSRYDAVWAYTNDWRPLWSWRGNTGHHPAVGDVDGDGRDEVLCGFALLDDDGRELWAQPLPGHADSVRIIPASRSHGPRFLCACCGGNDMALMDLPGRMLWRRQPERDPYHYQSTYVGRFSRDIPGLEIVVDEGWARPGRSRIRVISLEDGSLRGAYYTSYPRFAAMADFDGDGLDEMVFPTEGGIFDTRGRREVRLTDALPLGGPGAETPMVRVADVCGDGRPEVILFNAEAIQIYTDPLPAPGPRAKPPTTDPALHNFTYY